MAKKTKILGFVGSLRKGSYNKALMRAADALLPENVELEVFDLAAFPLFNQDFEKTASAGSARVQREIRNADAIKTLRY